MVMVGKQSGGGASNTQKRQFKDVLYDGLTDALTQSGFRRVDKDRINSLMAFSSVNQSLIYPNEDFFVLNKDCGKPNFTVIIKKHERDNSLTVLATNPREDIVGSALPLSEQYFKRIYKQGYGTVGEIAEEVLREVEKLASLKKDLRAQIHFHSRILINGNLAHDDGYSNIVSAARRAALYNVDFLAYTPHNALEYMNYLTMKEIMNEFGILFPLATEITAPLKSDHLNGPHHCVIAGDEEGAREIYEKIIKRRDKSLNMASYFLGMTLDEMYDVLQPLRQVGKVITGVAHPVNYSERILPIRSIGLLSAVEEGQISLESALSLARLNDFIEAWNDSIYKGEMTFRTDEFKETMSAWIAAHNIGDRISPNTCNLALALELEKDGIGASFGSDDHTIPPLQRNYLVGGDSFGKGWTVFKIKKGELPSDRKLTVAEIVRGIAKKEIEMGVVLFTELADGLIKIASNRELMPQQLKQIVKGLKKKQYKEYLHALIKDAYGFFVKGDIEKLTRMDK